MTHNHVYILRKEIIGHWLSVIVDKRLTEIEFEVTSWGLSEIVCVSQKTVYFYSIATALRDCFKIINAIFMKLL